MLWALGGSNFFDGQLSTWFCTALGTPQVHCLWAPVHLIWLGLTIILSDYSAEIINPTSNCFYQVPCACGEEVYMPRLLGHTEETSGSPA